MLEKIRKFSKTIFAKILLVIMVIPFIFWGMGGVFNSGNTNSIAKVNNDFENIFIDIIKRHKLFMTNYNKSHKKIVQELKPYGGQEKSIKRKIKNANTKIKDAQRVIDSFQKKLDIKRGVKE